MRAVRFVAGVRPQRRDGVRESVRSWRNTESSGCGFRNRGRPQVHGLAEQPVRRSVCDIKKNFGYSLLRRQGEKRSESKAGTGDSALSSSEIRKKR